MTWHNPESLDHELEIAMMQDELHEARQQRDDAVDALRELYRKFGNEPEIEVLCERVLSQSWVQNCV